jgi:hypothetical protein
MTDRNTELLRAAFEDFLAKRTCGFDKNADGSYVSTVTQRMWESYQAASTRLAEALGVIEELREASNNVFKWVESRDVSSDVYLHNLRAAITTAERFMKGEK